MSIPLPPYRNPRTSSLILQFLRTDKGTSAIAFALATPALLGAMGIAVDVGMLSAKRSRLQMAADQSAIAAAKELTVSNSAKSTISSAADSFARAVVSEPGSKLDVSVEVGSKRDSVKVILREEWTPFFAHFLKADVTPIVVHATAKLAGEANICVLALNPTANKALFMDKRAKIMAAGCGIYSNSKHAHSIRLDLDSDIKASLVCSAGGVQAKKTAVKPLPTLDCTPLPDPLAARAEPASGPCKATKLTLKSGDHVLGPGTYCGGLKITGTANVTFDSGDYVIKDGPFEVSKTASAAGENVAFFLSGAKSVLDFKDDTIISMTGASTGDMAGLLFFEDRNQAVGRTHRISSAHADKLTGTIYLPQGKLLIDPNNSVAADSDYTAIIVNQFELNEGPTLVLNSDYGASNVPVPEGIMLSNEVILAD